MLGHTSPDVREAVPGCPECDVAAGRRIPIGGLASPSDRLLVHAVLGQSPVAGWMVVAPMRHVEQMADLSADEMAEIGETTRRVAHLQRELLGARKSYVALFAEVVPHLHFHVIPRFDATPEALLGPKVFQAPASLMRPEEELETSARRLLAAITG